jgi:hypothetical protein
MDMPASCHGTPTEQPACERRRERRLAEPLPVTLRAPDGAGGALVLRTRLENLCAGGLYLRLTQGLAPGLPCLARLCFPPLRGGRPLRVALEGVVLRVEPLADGRFGTAVRVTWHRCL